MHSNEAHKQQSEWIYLPFILRSYFFLLLLFVLPIRRINIYFRSIKSAFICKVEWFYVVLVFVNFSCDHFFTFYIERERERVKFRLLKQQQMFIQRKLSFVPTRSFCFSSHCEALNSCWRNSVENESLSMICRSFHFQEQ